MFGITDTLEKTLEEIKSLIVKRTQNNKLTIAYGPKTAVVLYTNHISSIKSVNGNTNIYMDNGDVYQTSYTLEEVEDIIAGKLAPGKNKLYAAPRQTHPVVQETLKVSE